MGEGMGGASARLRNDARGHFSEAVLPGLALVFFFDLGEIGAESSFERCAVAGGNGSGGGARVPVAYRA